MVLITNFVDQAGSTALFPFWAQRVAHSSVALGLLGGAFHDLGDLGILDGDEAPDVIGVVPDGTVPDPGRRSRLRPVPGPGALPPSTPATSSPEGDLDELGGHSGLSWSG